MGRTRYVIVGTGHRAEMYVDAITGPHADVAQLVGMCDTNAGRAAYYEALLASRGAPAPAFFEPDALETRLQDLDVERVIITSPDFTHADYIVRVLSSGRDVVVEKPLTIDAPSSRRIVDAARASGRDVTVTFNYRYSPRNTMLKQIVQSGEIGDVTSIAFEWVLDTSHGADYFRRWHREKAKSGGLLIHKASHHFDLVNWWIADSPVRVFASGGLRFYGEENARARGLGERPARGTHDGPHDPFELDLRDDPRLAALYLEPGRIDGYVRDADVFGPGITIEDNLALVVDYQRGATMSYSLNAHSPWEGYRVAINGTRGRAELEVVERAAVTADESGVLDPSASPDSTAPRRRGEHLTVQTHWQEPREIEIPRGESAHGGGDALLLRDVFFGPAPDPLGRPSGYLDGVRSIAVGIAGNRSLATGLPVAVASLDLGADLTIGRGPGVVS
ncbi:Gfo/Idh/MocA family protein [Pseudolysinimonas sp.]|uniref:Gfo/Idh/MocA family protein n=1 Tax=Pseudolysinimonas sp. TaxID=2680009 RepID=UPI003F7CEAD1